MAGIIITVIVVLLVYANCCSESRTNEQVKAWAKSEGWNDVL